MASRRMIDPAFWQSETIASYPLAVRYFFIGLFSNADDQGRLRAHPALLRSLIYPYDDISLDDIKQMVDLLAADGGPIMVYEVDGRDLIQIVNWWRWQRPSWSWPSDLEPPPGWEDRVGHLPRKDGYPYFSEWMAIRDAVFKRDGWTCRYCGAPAEHVDHVIPICQAGTNDLENLAAACARCNLSKGGKTPEQAGMELL